MQNTPKWAQKWCPIHLIGTNSTFLTTDARLEKLKEQDWENLLTGRTILTNAFTDCENISVKEPFSSLDLILSCSDIHEGFECSKNPKLGKDTSKMKGDQYAPYGTSLQVLERLVEEGLKIGAIPKCKASDYLRRYNPLTTEEKLPPHPNTQPKIVEKENLTLLLSGKTERFEGNPLCPMSLICHENIGVEWTNKEGTRQAWINPKTPFLRVILTQETLFQQNPHTNLEFLCNPSFITLSKKDSKAAQKMVDHASEDAFFYQTQDEDQNFYDLGTFYIENVPEIDTFWNKTLLLEKACKSLTKTIHNGIESYIKETCPEVEKLLVNQWKKGVKLHLKFLQIKGGKIIFDTTLETKEEIIFLKGEAGKENPPVKKTRKNPSNHSSPT